MECSGLERQANWNQVWGLEERTQDVAHLLKKRVIYSVCPPALPSPLPPQCSDLSNVVQIETYSITYALAWIWQRLSELWWKEGAEQALKVKVKFLEPLELLPATPQKKKKKNHLSSVVSNASFLKHLLRSCRKAHGCKYQALLKLLLSWWLIMTLTSTTGLMGRLSFMISSPSWQLHTTNILYVTRWRR